MAHVLMYFLADVLGEGDPPTAFSDTYSGHRITQAINANYMLVEESEAAKLLSDHPANFQVETDQPTLDAYAAIVAEKGYQITAISPFVTPDEPNLG